MYKFPSLEPLGTYILWHPKKSTKPNIEVEQVEEATRQSLALSLNVSIDQIQAPRVAKLEMSVLVGERVVHLLFWLGFGLGGTVFPHGVFETKSWF